MDQELRQAIEKIHPVDGWVHLATIGPGGSPHVAPMMMGLGDGALLFSLTGPQKKRNIERDPRVAVSLAQAGTLAHVIVWGVMVMRHDAEAQDLWEALLRNAFGGSRPADSVDLEQKLSPEGTSLGVMTVDRHRIYGI